MVKIKIIFSIAFHNLRKWLINPRFYLIFIMLILYLYSRLSPINAFCINFGYKITPFVFPFIMSEPFSILLIMLGIILLFCDAPFIEIDQPYIIMRSGRKLWIFAQIVYIIMASVIYFVSIFLISLIIMLPNLELNTEWGKVIGTFAQTNIAVDHSITIPFAFSIYNAYTPLAALFISLLNCCLVSIFIGLCMFVLNLNISRSAGAIGAMLLILWQMVVTKTWTGFTKFSPVTWVSLSSIDTTGSTLYPTLKYIYIVIISIITLLSLITVFSMKRRDIDILKSV